MTHNEMFGNAKWIHPSSECSQPLMRKEFMADGNETAELTISGLGFFELYCNGKKVSSDLLVPAWTDYEPHIFLHDEKPILETRGHRVLVMQYDLTEFLVKGKNILGIALGAGWYEAFEYGTVKTCFKLELSKDYIIKTVLSDKNVKWTASQIKKSVMLRGETHDFNIKTDGFSNIEFDDSLWEQTQEIAPPESDFLLQTCPTDKIAKYLVPKLISENNGIKLYDTGENTAGYATLKCNKNSSGEVIVSYAEELYEDGSLNFSTYNYNDSKRNHIDRFILDGNERELYPHFLWHGFRYFTVEGEAVALRVAVTHSDVAVTSAFHSDNDDLNWLYDTYVRTQLANMHAGIPSDCPQREGQGYTGDGQLTCDAVMTTLDAKEFYRKWLGDISDCQCRETGHIQYVAPYTPCGGGPGGWGCAIIVVPYIFYKHYGELSILNQFYPQMQHYLSYLEAHSDNDLVTREDPAWAWCLGDWCTPDKVLIPEPFVNTYFYIKSLENMISIASLLGKNEDISDYKNIMSIKKAALIKNYYNEVTCSFVDGVQGADAFAIDIGLGNEKTFENLLNKYKELGMFDTGIFGTDILVRILFEHGEAQLAYDLLSSQKEVSFHNMKVSGATTLYEYWDGRCSHNHPMFGAVTAYLFKYLLGIKQKEKNIYEIEPELVNGLDYANGFVTTQFGKIEVSFVKSHEGTAFTITVADGIIARFSCNSIIRQLKAGKNEVFVQA